MTKRWYIVHAYSNFENKVAESIREQAKQRGLGDLFEEVMVPKEKVVEVRRGRKVDAERKFFPGYVLVKMDLTDEAFHLIKNTPKVTGFLGADNKPMPISDAEAARILHQVQEGIERSRRCPSRSANRFASPTVRSRPSTALSKRSTRPARASRSRCRSSAAPPRSSLSSARSRRAKDRRP
jgi:transcription antitermination factor NusG